MPEKIFVESFENQVVTILSNMHVLYMFLKRWVSLIIIPKKNRFTNFQEMDAIRKASRLGRGG